MSYLLVLMACAGIGEPNQHCTHLEVPFLEASECRLERNRVRFLFEDEGYTVETACFVVWYG